MRRFIILFAVLQLVAGNLVGLAHADATGASASHAQLIDQQTPIDGDDPTFVTCDICTHGLISGVGSGLIAGGPAYARSRPPLTEQAAPTIWYEDPAGEPPK